MGPGWALPGPNSGKKKIEPTAICFRLRLLDLGFEKDIKEILSMLKRRSEEKRQNVRLSTLILIYFPRIFSL